MANVKNKPTENAEMSRILLLSDADVPAQQDVVPYCPLPFSPMHRPVPSPKVSPLITWCLA